MREAAPGQTLGCFLFACGLVAFFFCGSVSSPFPTPSSVMTRMQGTQAQPSGLALTGQHGRA